MAVHARCHQDGGRQRQAAHGTAPDKLAVDRHAQGFTHPFVLERVLALDIRILELGTVQVQRQKDCAHLVAFEQLELAVTAQPGHVLRRQVGQQIELAGEQGGDPGRVGLDRGVDDIGDIALVFVPPVLVDGHGHLLVWRPAGDLVRPGAIDVARGEVFFLRLVVLHVGGLVLLGPAPVHHAKVDQAAQQSRVRCRQVHVDGVVVHLLDLLDAADVNLHRAVRLADAPEREDHVIGSEIGAVVKFDAAAQLEAHLGR